MQPRPRLTIVICTHNRSRLLRRCLQAITGLSGPELLEVIVVDNASTDDTPAVCEEFAVQIPSLRRVFEGVPGLSHARNHGLQEARCDLIGYIDDDVIIEGRWAEAMVDAFDRTGADAIGGRTLLYWDQRPPWWVSKGLYPLLGSSDYGPDELINDPDYFPNGGNMAFRKDTLARVGGFRTDLGVVSTDGRETGTLLGEDSRVGLEIARAGGTIVYCGGAIVRHLVDDRRCGLRALHDRSAQLGRTRVALGVTGDVPECEDEWLWAKACSLSSLCRLHISDAIAFHMRAVTADAIVRELRRQVAFRHGMLASAVKSGLRQRRGLMGLARRTLTGRPLTPPER